MRTAALLVALPLAAALAACQQRPLNETEYQLFAQALAESPKLQKGFVARCEEETTARIKDKFSDTDSDKVLSIVLDVPESQVVNTVCTRLVRAMASGRLSYREAKTFITMTGAP